MTTAQLNKAWTAVLKTLNDQYQELDQDFLDNVRKAVEVAYKPLFGDKKKKPRGVTAFNMYVSDFNAKHKDDAPVIKDGKQVTLFKLASVSWANADAKTRQHFENVALEQNAANGITPTADRPKKAVNGYNIFIQEYKEQHKDQLSGGTPLFKEASKVWKEKSAEEKAVYKQKADAFNEAHGNGKKETAEPAAPAKEPKAKATKTSPAKEAAAPPAKEEKPAKATKATPAKTAAKTAPAAKTPTKTAAKTAKVAKATA